MAYAIVHNMLGSYESFHSPESRLFVQQFGSQQQNIKARLTGPLHEGPLVQKVFSWLPEDPVDGVCTNILYLRALQIVWIHAILQIQIWKTVLNPTM